MLRDTGCRFLAGVLLAGATLFSHAATAQVRIQNGVVIRPDLKGNPPGGIRGFDGGTHTEKLCVTNKPCVTMVLVLRGGLDLSDPNKPKWDPEGCSAYWLYDLIRVRRGLQPVLTWVLVKDPGDSRTYVFHPTYGIQLTGNDPTHDLFKPTVDQNGTVFTWNNLHFDSSNKTITIPFLPVVWRIENGKPTKACNAGDPDVVNEN